MGIWSADVGALSVLRNSKPMPQVIAETPPNKGMNRTRNDLPRTFDAITDDHEEARLGRVSR